MVLKHLVPGHGRADPKVIQEIRRLAIKAERYGKFNTLFRRIVSHTFFLRRLPTVFFPLAEDVKAAKKLSCKSVFQQITERLILLLMFRFEPYAYYRLALFMPERYCRAGEFVDYRQHSFLSFLLNQNESAILTEDKLQFHELCVRNKLPSPAIIAVFEPDLTDPRELRAQIETVAQNEGVFFKPRFGLRAQGVGCIGFEKSGQWQARIGGKSFEFDTWQQVFDELSSIKQSLVFQNHLQNHPVLAGINPSVLHTIRLVTFRDGEEVHALEALLRLGKRGSLTDNISAGGIGVPIDLETNILGKGTTKSTADLPFSIHSCEPGGKEFVGLSVPFFEEAVELGKRVHEYFPEIFSLGHDIAILSDGPVIMETNHIWGDNQETFDVGHGSYRHFTDKILEIARTRKWIN